MDELFYLVDDIGREPMTFRTSSGCSSQLSYSSICTFAERLISIHIIRGFVKCFFENMGRKWATIWDPIVFCSRGNKK